MTSRFSEICSLHYIAFMHICCSTSQHNTEIMENEILTVFVCIPTALDPTISAAQKRYKSAL